LPCVCLLERFFEVGHQLGLAVIIRVEFCFKDYFEAKVPKANLPKKLALTEVPDIIANLSNRRQRHQRLIGFAAQTGEYEALAKEKMQNKDLDAIVANPVDLAQGGFGSDLNQGVWLDRWGRREVIPLCSKLSRWAELNLR
jgi:phosphopantothenoylcysteine decarboxylase / phosphopantothenate---cysteine ligase